MENNNRRDKWLLDLHNKENTNTKANNGVSPDLDEKKILEDKLLKAEKEV